MGRKRKQSSLPEGAITVRTYAEFGEYVQSFAEGKLNLLLVIGPPGVAKSQTVRRTLEGVTHLYLETHASALGIYHALYQHVDMPVVIDDLDSLYSDKGAVRLLKSLCNTDPVKHLRWDSRHSSIGYGDEQTPPEFTTRSPVCLMANRWETVNENVRAIEDRAIILVFDPPPGEVHKQTSNWFDDPEVFDFIGANLHLIIRPSMRLYVKGRQLKEAGKDWRDSVLVMGGVNDKIRAVVALLSDPRFKEEKERIEEFDRLGHGRRSAYFDWKGKVLPHVVTPDPEIIVRMPDPNANTTMAGDDEVRGLAS